MGHNNDPITLHKYLYAGNDPVLNVDPSGNSYLLGQLGSVSIMRTLATISVAAVGISSVDLTLDSNAIDGGFSGIQESYILLAAMSGAGSKILDLITSKLSENSEGRVVMYHGSSAASLVSLLNGAPLSAATAINAKFPGEQSEIGFYLTPDLLAAEFFGGRRGGGVIQFEFTNAAFQAVKLGSKTQSIAPLGASSQSPGIEMVVRPIIFPLFDSLRTSRQITASPVN